MTKSSQQRPRKPGDSHFSQGLRTESLASDYFRPRDFEYVQPLYDLAFLLEVDALAKGAEVPKYRTFSLWRAAYSLDGYGTTIDRWLDGTACDEDLDYVPSARIRQYLDSVRSSGMLAELGSYRDARFDRCLRLRSVRGLGPSKIALAASSAPGEEWFSEAGFNQRIDRERIIALCCGANPGPWQTAHIVPPLLRFLRAAEACHGQALGWDLSGIDDPFQSVRGAVRLIANGDWGLLANAINKALESEKHFRGEAGQTPESIRITHQMGWTFVVQPSRQGLPGRSISELAQSLDPISCSHPSDLVSDLHLHTAWSDGNASVNSMAMAAVASGLRHFAVTDHSRSCKLQGGLTPPLWLRQANALTLANPVCPVLHGIEVDILHDGTLDLPHSLLRAADVVVASVHSSWADDVRVNTNRLLKAIESGCIDIIAHPTSAIIGKPGVPDYVREPAEVQWNEVFEKCAQWRVAVELNCFPSRLDLPLHLLRQAAEAGCALSIGSDAHARSHLLNLRFGQAALRRLDAPFVLNRLPVSELKQWVVGSRAKRTKLTKTASHFVQAPLNFGGDVKPRAPLLRARIQPPQTVPAGSPVIGIDLTAGNKTTGVAFLNEFTVETCSLLSDDEIIAYIEKRQPSIVSIDSPLGLPGGQESIVANAGIVREAEYDLASVGIPAYPALIDSMEKLTLRGIGLRRKIEQMPRATRVIESYPGAAQDILCIPRKQKSLDLLREGLRRLGLCGAGLETRSHDEMDAITAAIVGRYFESGLFEPMGIPSEAQLIVPKVRPLVFDVNPVICLAGKTGAGKSVVARYLSLFYGFQWIRTRNVIRHLLAEDITRDTGERLFQRDVHPDAITENDLQEFGALILNRCRQIPLRQRLTSIVKALDAPIVVDSVRDLRDVDRNASPHRPLLTWFIECDESIIQSRLEKRSRVAQRRLRTASPVDQTAATLRSQADAIIGNSGSLEELRWRIDDNLFEVLSLNRSLET